MAGSLNFFGPVEIEGDREAWVERMRLQLLANEVIALAVLVVGVVLAFTVVDSAWSIVFCGALLADVVVVDLCRRRLDADSFVRVGVTMSVAIWLLAVVLAPLVPFSLPILLLAVLISMLGVSPLLPADRTPWFIAGGCVAAAVTTVLAALGGGPLEEELSSSVRDVIVVVGVTAFNVPLAFLAWDTHTRHRVAVDRLVDANRSLRSSRARLVDVADAERRQLERNLHDGAQQRLVGLAMRLRLLGSRAPELGDDVDVLLGELEGALDELRELAHGIYPPLLERQGLPDALRAAARRSPVSTVVDGVEDVGRHPPSVETALYFCCLEALQNAAKHAGDDATVRISLRAVDDALVLEVVDDGPGYDHTSVEHGRGVENMEDRMAAIDATLRIDTSPGNGVRLIARAPLARPGVQASPG